MSIDNSRALANRKSGAKAVVAQPRIGRPTREEAQRRHENLLEVALDMFLERGFDATTVEDIATAARMSKRTVYARYANKDELFVAVVHRARDRYTVSLEELQALETDDLAETLKAIALRRFENMTSSAGQRLFRVINAQAYRFPELALAAFNDSVAPAFEHLSEVFARFAARGEIEVVDYRKAAAAFLSLTLAPSSRIIATGNQLDPKQFEEHIDFSIRLFLNGLRRR